MEKKVDDLLDPQTGVYPMLRRGQDRLEHWAIGILTALVANAAIIMYALIR